MVAYVAMSGEGAWSLAAYFCSGSSLLNPGHIATRAGGEGGGWGGDLRAYLHRCWPSEQGQRYIVPPFHAARQPPWLVSGYMGNKTEHHPACRGFQPATEHQNQGPEMNPAYPARQFQHTADTNIQNAHSA